MPCACPARRESERKGRAGMHTWMGLSVSVKGYWHITHYSLLIQSVEHSGKFQVRRNLCLCMHAKTLQLCPTLCDPMDYTVHGILQARKLEWVAFLFSRGSSQPGNRTQVSHIVSRFFTSWSTREALLPMPQLDYSKVIEPSFHIFFILNLLSRKRETLQSIDFPFTILNQPWRMLVL